MESLEVTQALLSVGTVYHVRRPRTDETLYTIRGELMSTVPNFHLVEGDQGKALADLVANFIKTKYEFRKDDQVLGNVVFPAVAFKKTLTLTVGEDIYLANGGVFKGVFQCKNEGGLVLEIKKELGFRDSFLVSRAETFPLEIGLLCAVAIHSRFYELV
jgi:uncharacterized protein YxjI